ncbi:hypothetical protein ACFX13_013438 [Malus domestica]
MTANTSSTTTSKLVDAAASQRYHSLSSQRHHSLLSQRLVFPSNSVSSSPQATTRPYPPRQQRVPIFASNDMLVAR